MPLFSRLRSRRFFHLAEVLRRWNRRRSLMLDPVLAGLIERNRARQEYRMAWWRLALALVPALEAGLDPTTPATRFTYGIVAYALSILIVSRRHHHFLWRWGFALGDLALLQIYVLGLLQNRSPIEAAFAYAAVGNILTLTHSLRLSLPLLWCSAGGLLLGYYTLFAHALQETRVAVGGAALLLIGAVLGAMILRNQRRLLVEVRARARLRRFVSRDVADEIELGPVRLDQPEAREVTVLFVDIRGFTSLAETLTPVESVEFLNAFFQRVTQAVFAQRGAVDKYLGDGVMALFGAPVAGPDGPARAVQAALGIVRAIDAWNIERASHKLPPVKVGIGLNTAKVVVGTVGTPEKLEYTAIGDGVNIAARLCELTKLHPHPILLAESTRQQVAEPLPFDDLGLVEIRGRSAPLHLYGLKS